MMRRGKLITVCGLVAVLGGMTTLVAYAVPLYRLFCQATGYGGTTQVANGPADRVADRRITVRFNTDVSSKLAWKFEPLQDSVTVRVGEPALAFFRAKSMSPRSLVGQATFNVTPDKVGQYFVKVQCFCFDEQRLDPGAEADLPVQFHIDPAIMNDRNADEVSTITLSYTFFRAEHQDTRKTAGSTVAPAASGPPSVPAVN